MKMEIGKDELAELEDDFIYLNMRLMNAGINLKSHETARIIAHGLRRRGYNVRVVDGAYFTTHKPLIHTWIEWRNYILETDPRQLRRRGGFKNDIMPDEPFSVLEKSLFAQRYAEIEIPKEAKREFLM